MISVPVTDTRAHATDRLTLAAVTGGQFLAVLSSTAVGVALPTIGHELHTGATTSEWIVNAYVLVYASLMVAGGGLGDRYGRKGAFLLGVTLFGVGALLGGLAPSVPILLAGRVIQGLGPALLVPSSLAIVRATFHDERQRAMAIGLWSTSSGLGMAIGPVFGGVVVAELGWRWVLLLNAPLAAVVVAVAALAVPRLPHAPAAHDFDWAAAPLTTVAVGAPAFGLIEGQQYGWTSATTLGAFAVAALTGAAFLRWERRRPEPLVDIALFRDPAFAAANLAGLVVFFAFIGLVVYLSAYFQQLQGHSAIRAGFDVCAIGIAFAVAAPISGRLVGRFGARPPMVAGLLLGGGAVLGLLGLQRDTGLGAIWWVLALGGFGIGLSLTPMTATAVAAVLPHRTGMASAVHNGLRQVGQVLGVAVLGALAYGSSGLNIDGLHHAFAVAGISMLVTALIAAAALHRRPEPIA
ncbi:MFS transporter [Nocardia sp. alder85J]|uniref:MFS transporter n=1 Tax=Nocardia sp. alder85J TaxID=2862949 RepID=UPI001CD6D768|nr:MFS transporter [Nocardia sp. alder85J]MCX4096097.1 MFS transporter [Nocardia sp. alder85J]